MLVGHGSTVNAGSSAPTRRHAQTLREHGVFREVHECFWKEEPSLVTILDAVRCDDIYVVPNFISEGYFTRVVLPREMKLDGPVTRRGKRTIRYCAPVGSHPRMTELLLRRAREAMPDAPAAATSLFIVGHGTDRHANSSSAAREQADRLRALGEFAEVFPAFLEEPPRIADWFTLATQPHVVVVPFFIADGLHGGEDIPALLGLDRNAPGPQHLHGRTISYTGAIGTDPLVADLIVEQAAAFR